MGREVLRIKGKGRSGPAASRIQCELPSRANRMTLPSSFPPTRPAPSLATPHPPRPHLQQAQNQDLSRPGAQLPQGLVFTLHAAPASAQSASPQPAVPSRLSLQSLLPHLLCSHTAALTPLCSVSVSPLARGLPGQTSPPASPAEIQHSTCLVSIQSAP